MRILYFASIREAIGMDEEASVLPTGLATIGDLIGWLAGRSDAHAEAFADRAKVRAAIDQAFAKEDAPIAGAREIAFFPPVTGG